MTADVAKCIRAISDRHDLWSVWSDFVEMSAIAISNACDLVQREVREERYLAIAKKYDQDTLRSFCAALAQVSRALEDEPDDVLGRAFMQLELGSKWAGQFFTPMPLCRLMAAMQVESMRPVIEHRGFVTASDPAVGGGAMLVALAAEMRAAGFDYQTQLHATAQDIDARAAHMAYVQLSLLGIPAVVVVGDTLRLERREVWYTPAHVLGGWLMRLRAEQAVDPKPPEPARIDPEPEMQVGQLALFGGAR